MDFSSFNEFISKINGVTHVKVVVENDDLQEVHILANNLRSPKQIVRDIEAKYFSPYLTTELIERL